MYPTIFFILSGIGIASLLFAKVIEERSGKKIFILRAIARGEERIRFLSHEMAHGYSEFKEKFILFSTKQLPLRAKSLLMKWESLLRREAGRFTEAVRDSKFLKKSDGISEYFKSIKEVERGNGEINDTFGFVDEDGQNDKNEVDYKN